MNVWTILNEDLIAVKHEFLPEGARPSENCMPGEFALGQQYVYGGWTYDYLEDTRAKKIREIRNQLLKESDWTQSLDSKVNKEEWATYRQQLRDIPSQLEFPYTVQWPTQPTTQVVDDFLNENN